MKFRSFLLVMGLGLVGCGDGNSAHSVNPADESGVDAAGAVADSGGASTDATTAVGFCLGLAAVVCEQSFACSPTSASSRYGALADCVAQASCRAAGFPPCPHGYDPGSGATCVTETRALACGEFLAGAVPASCQVACPAVHGPEDAAMADGPDGAGPRDASDEADSGGASNADSARGAEGAWDGDVGSVLKGSDASASPEPSASIDGSVLSDADARSDANEASMASDATDGAPDDARIVGDAGDDAM